MFSRRRQLTPAARRAVPLAGGERHLAAAELADGGHAVATTAGLAVLTDDAAPRLALRRPWCDVDRAAFDPERSVLTVEWVDAEPDLHLSLTDPVATNLPAVLHERVLWSVLLAETVDVPGGRVRVAVRRRLDGSLFSQALAEEGVDLARPDVADVVNATESSLRGACGLPL
ncbi:hypothetical protein MWU57_10450 [Isoptericola sp. S6320L]|uniref:hypothetical protein n=1 Tax=Isoptericola sp. S6320L TaxID=2926411 RepID=UPI001FF6EAA5|nr:hypothetical protein [Isoptericola sp. S6320L]MCK0117452.1 hypothetical protein [Isoptericola sp. S6320L]